MTPIIEATGLVKRYGKIDALAGLDLTCEAGRVVALLGPNGAGKTTFVRSVATLLRPDAGTLRVAGHDALREPHLVRRSIGLAGQYAAVEEAMTGRENLTMVARLYGQKAKDAAARAQEVLVELGLDDAGDRLVRTYSGGMRRRLDLGASLVGRPRLLLLDEPTTGLDPRSRNELWAAIRDLVERGTDVLLTTQYLEEADQLASRIVIIDHGRVIADGSPAELKRQGGRDVIELHLRDHDRLGEAVDALAPLAAAAPVVDAAVGRVSIAVDAGTQRLLDATRALEERSITVDDIALRRPTLDEVFLSLTGRGTDDAAEAGAA